MPIWNNYHLAQSTNDALQALSAAPGPARLIAGGTDLLLDLQQGRHPAVDTLVDVTGIPELTALEFRGTDLFIGAAVPLSRIVRSPLVQQHAQALVEACDLIGGPQVRNTATLGGNVAHALPAADGTIALLALGGVAEIASALDTRQAPLEDLFRGPGQSNLDPKRELLAGFYLPLKRPGQASAFSRVMRPQGVALPILNLAVWLERRADRIVDVRIAAGPSGPRPVRARAAEEAVRGQVFDGEALTTGLEALLLEAHFRTSPYRATKEYRRDLAGVLLEEALSTAWKRAENSD
ncbi:MAG TPA: FAD binding domain-containing protein [Anaerolineales bacterium]|jgi:carbon-monoxide dehydrogenase medium subunit|nr:FAD binding domain-containing protein [Anaerolineales bacterium]